MRIGPFLDDQDPKIIELLKSIFIGLSTVFPERLQSTARSLTFNERALIIEFTKIQLSDPEIPKHSTPVMIKLYYRWQPDKA
jgi:hypothetical protein